MSAANATVIYQSIPDLTVSPFFVLCSQCSGDGQSIGQLFSLRAAATATSVSFAVDNTFVPTSVTVGIYNDSGGTVGSVVYNQTFSSFASDVPTGNKTDVVTVNIGAVSLPAGTFDLFLTNPVSLAIPVYEGFGPGNQIIVALGESTSPLTGDSYSSSFLGADSAVSITGSVSGGVPEPSTWALMGLGFVGLGLAAYRRRRRTPQSPSKRCLPIGTRKAVVCRPSARLCPPFLSTTGAELVRTA
jgi:hypothetical protein